MIKVNILHYYRKFVEKSRLKTGFLRGKRIDIILLIIAIAVIIFITARRVSVTTEKHEHIDITISSQFGDLFGRDTVNALILEFEKQNPYLRVQEAGREAPDAAGSVTGGADIILFDDSEFGSLLNASALSSLAPYNDTESGTRQWALPLVTFMDIFVYNIDILQAANLDRPPKTRAEFLSAAMAVAERNRATQGQKPVYAYALGLSPDDPAALRREFYPWVWSTGRELHTDMALSGAASDVVAFFGSLNRGGLLAPRSFEATGAQRLKEFAEGTIAMMTASARDIAFLQKAAQGITFGITTIPVITYDKNRVGISGIYAGISSACALPDEAWLFLAFIAEKNNIFAEALGAVPGIFPGVFADEYILNDPLYSKAWDIFEAADIVEYEPGQPYEEKLNVLIREKLAEAFR